MTREETKKAIEVMQHFANGGEVKWRYRNHVTWYPLKEGFPWNFESYDYCIKPEPISIPATEEELEIINAPIYKNKYANTMYKLTKKEREDRNFTPKNSYMLNPDTKCWEDWSEK